MRNIGLMLICLFSIRYIINKQSKILLARHQRNYCVFHQCQTRDVIANLKMVAKAKTLLFENRFWIFNKLSRKLVHSDIDYVKVITPYFPVQVSVLWEHIGEGSKVKVGTKLCSIFKDKELIYSIYSPKTGIIEKMYLPNEIRISQSEVLCTIKVDSRYYDYDPVIVKMEAKSKFTEGSVKFHRGVGALVKKGELICTVVSPDSETQYNFYSPIDGLISEIYPQEKKPIINFDNLFMAIPFDLVKGRPMFTLLVLSQFFRFYQVKELIKERLFRKECLIRMSVDLSNLFTMLDSDVFSMKEEKALYLMAFSVKASAYALRHHMGFAGYMTRKGPVQKQSIDISIGLKHGMSILFPTIRNAGFMKYSEILASLKEIKRRISFDIENLTFDNNTFTISFDSTLSMYGIIPGSRTSSSALLTLSYLQMVPVIHKNKLHVRPMCCLSLMCDRQLGGYNSESVFLASKIKNACENPCLCII